MGHAIERLMLIKLVQDYANKHGVEYHPNLQVRFQRVAQDILQHAKTDACKLCELCDKESCKLN